MMGLTPTAVVAATRPLGLAAVGANCGRSLQDTDALVTEFVAELDAPLWIKPNAGVPKVVGDSVVYEVTPTMLAEHALDYVARGARIVGGCCGSTPEHIAAISLALGR